MKWHETRLCERARELHGQLPSGLVSVFYVSILEIVWAIVCVVATECNRNVPDTKVRLVIVK